MNFILFPDPIDVTRPTTNGSSKDIQTINPIFREDSHSALGYTFVYPEPIWRERVTTEAIWDNASGKYTRRYKNGRIAVWTDERAVANLCQKRVNLKIRGMRFSMDWDAIDSFCRKCPDVEVTTVDGNEYLPLTDTELMALVTRENCQCAEFTFMRETGVDKQSRNCRHIKLLMTDSKNLMCDICCASETCVEPTGPTTGPTGPTTGPTSPTTGPVEFFQYCERKNCDHLMCSQCYESIATKFASCPYCRKDF